MRCGVILVLGLIILHGCASRSNTVTETESTSVFEPPVSTPSDSSLPTPEPTISRGPSSIPSKGQAQVSKPVATLLAKAESDLQAGHLERSAASLERAIRISPRNPILWHRLAEVHLKQGNLRQAEAMAIKSNSLIGPGAQLARDTRAGSVPFTSGRATVQVEGNHDPVPLSLPGCKRRSLPCP